MRYIAVVLFVFFVSSFNSYAQSYKRTYPFSISFGLNFIDSTGEQNPLNLIKQTENIAFGNPLEVVFGYEMTSKLELYGGLSFNKFRKNQNLDGIILANDLGYSAIDLGIRHYPLNYPLGRFSDINLFIHGGFSIISLNKSFITGNFGAGVLYNISRDIGFYLNATAKYSLDNKVYQSNHFQYAFGVKLKVFGNCGCPIFR